MRGTDVFYGIVLVQPIAAVPLFGLADSISHGHVVTVFSGLQVYLAQRVWPDFCTFSNLETAFVDVSRVVGGNLLFQGMAVTLILASFGSGVSGQAGASGDRSRDRAGFPLLQL